MKNFEENIIDKSNDESTPILDLTNFKLDEWKTPYLFETWNWEGDETILPFKWLQLAKFSPFALNYSDEKLKEFLGSKYYNDKNFDKKSFFFITHRSDTAGCVYVNHFKGDNTFHIDFLILNDKKYRHKGIEQALVNLAIKRAVQLNNEKDTKIYINRATSNVKIKEILNIMGIQI